MTVPSSAFETYSDEIDNGDDGREDFSARKACNYMEDAVEVSRRRRRRKSRRRRRRIRKMNNCSMRRMRREEGGGRREEGGGRREEGGGRRSDAMLQGCGYHLIGECYSVAEVSVCRLYCPFFNLFNLSITFRLISYDRLRSVYQAKGAHT